MKITIPFITAIISLLMLNSTCLAIEGYELLFRNIQSKLTQKEKQQIFEQMGFRLSRDKKTIEYNICGNVSPSVKIVDLNNDGVEEVFVDWGNTCSSGFGGRSVTLFIKDRKGKFIKNLDFPGAYEKLATYNKGFPDLMIGGPGFCFGVWQWDGAKYKHKCNREMEPGGCSRKGVGNICK